MSNILKKISLVLCLYGFVHQAQAQAPVKRLMPGATPRPIKKPSSIVKKDYQWYLADFKKRYPDHAQKLNVSPAINRAGGIQANRFSKNRNATVNSIMQAQRLRMAQRYPQYQQQMTARRMMGVRPRLTYQQVAAMHNEQARKRMEALRRGDLK